MSRTLHQYWKFVSFQISKNMGAKSISKSKMRIHVEKAIYFSVFFKQLGLYALKNQLNNFL